LAGAGARVALVARRAAQLDLLAAEVDGLAIPSDLTVPDEPGRVMACVAEGLGEPEILVNAAGNIFTHEKAEDEPLEAILATLQLNLVVPFRLAQEAFPHMVALGRGSIINISSISGHVGIPSIPQASYAASKMGLSGLTAELAVQWARHSIRVNTVAPGFFRSEITAGMYDDDKGLAWFRRNTPLPRDGSVDDFSGAVLWLASDAGRYVTGQTIVIDGGWTVR
jgi:NAD(P)-dependent dehydrogenase (short-subunit alcohol dehydrogenase family)